VVLTHANLLANVKAMGKAARATTEDVFVSWLPLYHDMGLIGGCFATMYLGFPVVLMSPLAFLSRPSQWLRAIHRHGGTISGGPTSPTSCACGAFRMRSWRARPRVVALRVQRRRAGERDTLAAFEKDSPGEFQKKRDFAGLRPGRSLGRARLHAAGGAVAGRPHRSRLAIAHRRSGAGAAERPSPLKVVGCGASIPDHDLRVVDAAGLELPDRSEGNLQFRGPSATSGYYRNPEATKDCSTANG